MPGHVKKQFTVNFQEPSDDSSDAGQQELAQWYIDLQLSDQNTVDGSVFPLNSDVYIDVYRWPYNDVQIESMAGTLKKSGSNINVKLSKNISFVHSDQGTLAQAPYDEFSYEWQNRERPEPAISVLGRSLTLNREVFNVLQVKYSSKKDTYILNNVKEPTEVVVYASMGEVSASLTVRFGTIEEDAEYPDDSIFEETEEETEEETKEEVVDGEKIVKAVHTYDCTTGISESGWAVYVNNKFQGLTNSQGNASIGERTVGETVTIRCSKDGQTVTTDRVIESSG